MKMRTLTRMNTENESIFKIEDIDSKQKTVANLKEDIDYDTLHERMEAYKQLRAGI